MLEIGSARLSSYLYGRVLNVPGEIMERARALSVGHNRLARKMRVRFGPDVPMNTIVTAWERLLAIVPPSNVRLAEALGVFPSTVSRWRAGKGRPSMFDLARLDRRVREEVA